MDPKESTPAKGVDLEAVTKLVDALEEDLAQVRAGSSDVQALRDEVERLRAVLNAEAPHESGLHDRLHTLREKLEDVAETLREDAFTGSQYIAMIGRMLGM